jgi:hypothetical protein
LGTSQPRLSPHILGPAQDLELSLQTLLYLQLMGPAYLLVK